MAGALGVRLVGRFAVLRAAGAVEDRLGMDSRKATRLLALLAVRRGHLVPISQVVEVLWADGPPKRPVPDVATLVSRLRGLLGADAVLGGRAATGSGRHPRSRWTWTWPPCSWPSAPG